TSASLGRVLIVRLPGRGSRDVAWKIERRGIASALRPTSTAATPMMSVARTIVGDAVVVMAAGFATFGTRFAASASGAGSVRAIPSEGNASNALLASAVFWGAAFGAKRRTNPLYHRCGWIRPASECAFNSAVSCPSIRESRAARGDDCMGSPPALECLHVLF